MIKKPKIYQSKTLIMSPVWMRFPNISFVSLTLLPTLARDLIEHLYSKTSASIFYGVTNEEETFDDAILGSD